VPTIPYTSDTNTSLLLNFTNAGIYDATSKNDLETVDGAQISNTTAKWGSTSIKFDGTGDRLQIPDNNLFTLGSGDFTIEFWAYTTTTNNQTVIIQIDSGGSTTALSFGVQINTSKWRGILASGSTFYSVTSSANAIANQWNHIAFVRNGNTGTLYINGTADGTVSLTGVTINDSSQVVSIGGEISGSTMLNGYLQDLRITKGYARYVTGTGANAGKMVFNGTNDLALPTAAFPTL
jgi:hypothetical protein